LYKSPANTLFVGKNVVFVPECHSTNTLALQLSQNTAIAEGTIVITPNQTAGRGQRGSTWQTEAGKNLTASVILKPLFLDIKDQFYLTIATALAIADFLKSKTVDALSIKWPNDILVQGKKICGILIENQLQGTKLQTAIVGIGLNVNQTSFELPTATSLANLIKQESDINDVLGDLMGYLEARYLQLRQGKFASLKHEYLMHLYWKGERHFFQTAAGEIEAVIVGVGEDGRLAVEVNERLESFDLKEIQFLR
jgi:BirA family transcriptional regulator, biotin operon repressor / biotin---[acetyl-CoA-carboxylase] ligase